jgi:hypothetical protein
MVFFLFSEPVNSFSWFKSDKDTAKTETSSGDTKAPEGATKSKEKDSAGKAEKSDAAKKSSDSKDKGKVVVKFKDGSVITESEVKEGVDQIPDQLAARMSLADVKNIVAWRMAYTKVLKDAAKKSGLTNDPEVRKIIESRLSTAAGLLLLDHLTNESMTFTRAKEHYNATWDKNFKNTKEFTLIAITTSDPKVVQRLKRGGMSEEEVRAFLKENSSTTRFMDMNARPQGMFPPEISDAVLAAESGTVIGPFETNGAYMLFFVKKVGPAKKQEFTDEFFETYKETARRDLINTVLQDLYKKYSVEAFDVAGNPIDVFKIGEADQTDLKDGKADKAKKDKGNKGRIDLSKAKDDAILGTIGTGDAKENLTVYEVKTFYKVESLVDDTLAGMARQFGISLEDVVLHAIKLCMDGKVLEKEVKATKFNETPDAVVKLSSIEDMEVAQQYLSKNISVKKSDIKNAYNKFVKSIPAEERNDHDIAVKMIFFRTHEEASKTLQKISSGGAKFGDLFKAALDDGMAIDLGYIRRKGTPPDLWKEIKAVASGTCCKEALKIDGSQFGIDGAQYAAVHVSDRRPITIPTVEQEPNMYKGMAEREKASEIVKELIQDGVISVYGRSIKEWYTNPEYINRLFVMFIGTPGSPM